MTIFAILLPHPQPELAKAVREAYANDHYMINDLQWLVSSDGTAVDVSAKLGIFDAKAPSKTVTGSAIVLATSSYFGRAPTPVWEWMKAKLEGMRG